MEKILMNIEPRATRTAGVAHTPPLGRQTSWHQCLTECQRVGRLLLVNARAETTVQLADGHVQSFRERTSVFSEVVGFMPSEETRFSEPCPWQTPRGTQTAGSHGLTLSEASARSRMHVGATSNGKPYAAPYKASSVVHLPGGVVVALKSVLRDAHTTMHK